MIFTKITFKGRRQKNHDQLKDLAENYLASLLHSGQIGGGDYSLTWEKGHLNAYVLLAGRGAWMLRYHSDWGKALNKLVDVLGMKPEWVLLDDDIQKSSSSWKRAPNLYLFTHAFDPESPVCRGDGKPPIPVFLLPITFELKAQLYSWRRNYYHLDNLWLGSGVLELGAYRELADPCSELSQQGRDLCRGLESVTKIPTFYYLMRYWSRTKREEERPCPGCGAQWKVARNLQKPSPFWDFDFRCERCRLVSHIGVSTDGGRHTRIGEFHEKKKDNPGGLAPKGSKRK